MLKTRFTELVGCVVPIQQAGMGQLANPGLAAAVANAGGLGMITLGGYAPPILEEILDTMPEAAIGAVGVNFIVEFIDRGRIGKQLAVVASRVRVVDFFWGDPDSWLVEQVHTRGALASWQVGSREEAVAAAEAGCDFISAQGIGAGGHVRGTIGCTVRELHPPICSRSGSITVVIMDDAAKHITASHHARFGHSLDRSWAALLNSLVRPSMIVILDIFEHHSPQMSFSQYQQPVQTFLAH